MLFRSKAFLDLILITQMFSPVVLLIPLFRLYNELGLLGSLQGVIIAGSAFTLPFSIWLLTGFFRSIPVELEEAAYVDGAGRLRTFVSIILPLAAPAIATLAVISFLGYWNDYLWPLITCQGPGCTLAPGLRNLQGTYSTRFALLSTLPAKSTSSCRRRVPFTGAARSEGRKRSAKPPCTVSWVRSIACRSACSV